MSTLPRDSAAEHQTPLVAPPRHTNPLEEAVRQFEALADDSGVKRLSSRELREICRKVTDLTTAIFPGESVIEVRGDPEILEELHFTFKVVVTGVDEAVAKNDEWHRSLRRIAGAHAVLFCLSIDVR